MNCGCLVIAIQLFFALSLLKEGSVDQFITPTGWNLHLGKPLRSGESTQLTGLIQRLSHILLQQSSRDICSWIWEKIENSYWGLSSRLSLENKCRLVSHFEILEGGVLFKVGPSCGRLTEGGLTRRIDFNEGMLLPPLFVWCVYKLPSMLTTFFFIMRLLKRWWIDVYNWRECVGSFHSLFRML